MTHIFGDRMDFAIEAGVEPDNKPGEPVWGHMCVWCRGVPLGVITERQCGIYQAYTLFVRLRSFIDHLWAEELNGLDDVAAWNLFDGLLYGFHGAIELPDDRTLEECQRDAAVDHVFDFLTNWGEQFDGYKSFIMRPPGGPVRILSRRLPEHMGRGVEVSRDGFVEACDGFIDWFENQEVLQGFRSAPQAGD